MKKSLFYASVRTSLFSGSIPQHAVDSVECLLSACAQHGVTDLGQIAYILATAYHEVGPNMVPVGENLNYSASGLLATWPTRFNAVTAKLYERKPEKIANFVYCNRMGNGDEKSGEGWKYRGRDFCQTTGKSNYERAARFAGVDLVKYPERISEPSIACHTIVVGMKLGWFTGRKLSDYITGAKRDFTGARRIINGTDKAEKVAGYAEKFYKALSY
jgi:putative chitinase